LDLNLYEFLKDDIDPKASFSRDEISNLKEALLLADSHPKVVLFRWRACAVAVNASRNNGSWSFEYYDPISRASMMKDPFLMREMVKRSSSIKAKVQGEQVYIIDQDLKDMHDRS
jgi:hypothetical protein